VWEAEEVAYIEIIRALFFSTFEWERKENIIRGNYAVKTNRHQIGTLSEFVAEGI
jgi:hypothetical protein